MLHHRVDGTGRQVFLRGKAGHLAPCQCHEQAGSLLNHRTRPREAEPWRWRRVRPQRGTHLEEAVLEGLEEERSHSDKASLADCVTNLGSQAV
jgi:hypothetical protein